MAQATAKKQKKRKSSVLKRIRQTIRRTEVNRANRSRVRTAMKVLRSAIAAGDAPAAKSLLPETLSAIDIAIRIGALKENTANRYKSNLALAVNALQAPA
jgi:small subunit ribosomal protein S20